VGIKKAQIYRDKKEVTLTLSVRAGAVNISPRADLSKQIHKVRNMHLVIAREQECVDAKTGEIIEVEEKKKAVWYLLTDLPVGKQFSASKIVDFYALRWQIERFHYVLKSGALNVEKLQFSDINTLCNALTFYGVVAWQLLTISVLSKNEDVVADTVFDKHEIDLLERLSGKKVTTLIVALQVLAGLIGFKPTKKYPYPGVKILVQAFERFHFIKVGAEAAMKGRT
jgi:transposase